MNDRTVHDVASNYRWRREPQIRTLAGLARVLADTFEQFTPVADPSAPRAPGGRAAAVPPKRVGAIPGLPADEVRAIQRVVRGMAPEMVNAWERALSGSVAVEEGQLFGPFYRSTAPMEPQRRAGLRALGACLPTVRACEVFGSSAPGWWTASADTLEIRLRRALLHAPVADDELAAIADALALPRSLPYGALLSGPASPVRYHDVMGAWMRAKAPEQDACYFALDRHGQPLSSNDVAARVGSDVGRARDTLRRDPRVRHLRPLDLWWLAPTAEGLGLTRQENVERLLVQLRQSIGQPSCGSADGYDSGARVGREKPARMKTAAATPVATSNLTATLSSAAIIDGHVALDDSRMAAGKPVHGSVFGPYTVHGLGTIKLAYDRRNGLTCDTRDIPQRLGAIEGCLLAVQLDAAHATALVGLACRDHAHDQALACTSKRRPGEDDV